MLCQLDIGQSEIKLFVNHTELKKKQLNRFRLLSVNFSLTSFWFHLIQSSHKHQPDLHDEQVHGHTYPSVLMKPFVDPSAYREQMSPMCRKLDILSDMVDIHEKNA